MLYLRTACGHVAAIICQVKFCSDWEYVSLFRAAGLDDDMARNMVVNYISKLNQTSEESSDDNGAMWEHRSVCMKWRTLNISTSYAL